MPEGDSIHTLARRLERILVGKAVRAFEGHPFDAAVARSLVGRKVVAVEAKGKNLLVSFDDGRSLHVHLRMLGRIRVERPRSAFYAPRRARPQLRIAVDGGAIVGSRIPVLRLLSTEERARAPELARLGPDLASPAFDVDEGLRLLRKEGGREIGDALLLQRVVAGIGNVFKSEVLFLEKIDPRTKVAALHDDELRALLLRASALIRANVRPGPRVTRRALAGPRLWVYGRAGEPCLRCKTAIVRTRQGPPPGRSTYHCPSCQSR